MNDSEVRLTIEFVLAAVGLWFVYSCEYDERKKNKHDKDKRT
jgi:hypothetical protein